MSAKMNIAGKCFALSGKIMPLGTAINGRRNAQILFSQLVEASADLGAGVCAVDYLPARSMRTQQVIDLVKCAQKIIYMLNFALREGTFLKKPCTEALGYAVDIANDVNALVQAYVAGGPVPAVSPSAEQPAALAEEKVENPVDPDGFSAPYDGTI